MTTVAIVVAVVLGVGLGTAVAVGRALRRLVEEDKARYQRLRDAQGRIDRRIDRDEGDVA